MKRTLPKALAAAGAAAFLLSGCNMVSGSDSTDNATDDAGDSTPVYEEIASWNACEILDNLQPITDYMGIKGYGSSTSEGGSPGNSELGNTFDPDAMGCNGLIYLGEFEGSGLNGEIQVKIVPTNSEEDAVAAYEERVASAESESASGADALSDEFGDPWDQGAMVSWIGDADQPHVQVIARDGQWVLHIDLYHSTDYGVYAGFDPALPFTPDERNQWLVNTYLPEINQVVNDKLAEVQ